MKKTMKKRFLNFNLDGTTTQVPGATTTLESAENLYRKSLPLMIFYVLMFIQGQFMFTICL